MFKDRWRNTPVPQFVGAEQPTPVFQAGFDGGIRLDVAPHELAPDETPLVIGLLFEDSGLVPDYGYAVYTTVANAPRCVAAHLEPNPLLGSFVSFIVVWFTLGPSSIVYTLDRFPKIGGGGPWDSANFYGLNSPINGSEAISAVSIQGKFVFTAGTKIQLFTGSGIADLSADAPVARFVASFGDRLLAFQVNRDDQAIAWSVDGNIQDWTGPGSGLDILVDTKSDVKDALQGGTQVGANTFAMFRERSIWRVFETGNAQKAIGEVPWIEGVGTRYPFTIANTGMGVAFIGTDRMVYILSPSGSLMPVGFPVKQLIDAYIESTGDNPNLIFGWYDAGFNEYWIPNMLVQDVNGNTVNAILALDLMRLSLTGKPTWRLKFMPANAQVTAAMSSSTQNVPRYGSMFGMLDNNIYRVDRNVRAVNGYWVSPPMRVDPTYLHTLRKISLHGKDTHGLRIDVSRNGGQSWPSSGSPDSQTTVLRAQSAWSQAFFNTTAADLRFRVVFPSGSSGKILRAYRAEFVRRGKLEYDTGL